MALMKKISRSVSIWWNEKFARF